MSDNRPASPKKSFAVIALVLAAAIAGGLLYLAIPWLVALLAGINGATILLYGYDKAVAGGRRTRVPETVLQGLALAGGSPGALIGQLLFRHKTVKGPFQRVFWLIVVLQLAALGTWIWLWIARPAWLPPSFRILFPS